MNNIELNIVLPAFLAGLLVLSIHVPLGIEVLKRGIIFIDLAIAQIAGLGALVATLFFEHYTEGNIFVVQIFSLFFAITGALMLTWTEKKFPDIQEAIIGCLFVFSASLALLLTAQNPHGSEHMKDILAGQILFVSFKQIILTAFLYAILLGIWFFKKQSLSRIGFYLIFAFAITASVQLVGVYLVFASLILPAISARSFSNNKKLLVAYLTGIIGLITGLLASIIYDFSTGPIIVCTLFLTSICFIIFGSKQHNTE